MNRKNTNHASNENESIINQDISSKHARSPRQRTEAFPSKQGEPQSFAGFAQTEDQPILGATGPRVAASQEDVATPRSKEIGRKPSPAPREDVNIREASGSLTQNKEQEEVMTMTFVEKESKELKLKSNEKTLEFSTDPEPAPSSAPKEQSVFVEPLNFPGQSSEQKMEDKLLDEDVFQASIKDEEMKSFRREEENRELRQGGDKIRIEHAVSDKRTSSVGYHDDGPHPSLLPPQDPLPLDKVPSMPTPTEQALQYTQDGKSTE